MILTVRGKTSARIVGLQELKSQARVLQAESPDILTNFDSVFVDEPTQPQYLAWLRSLPVAASSLPALIGLHAAAIVSPLADAFDAAADADANADADAPALTLSIRSPHVWVKR